MQSITKKIYLTNEMANRFLFILKYSSVSKKKMVTMEILNDLFGTAMSLQIII